MSEENKKQNNDQEEKSKNQTGRPLKSVGPAVPWDEVDSLLVHGEAIDNENGKTIHYPSIREIAERYNVSHTTIQKHSRRYNCVRRRKQLEKKVKELTDTKLAELRADELAVRKADIVRTIDRFLVQFEEAVNERRVRCDNPTDYNTLVRLKNYVVGDADSRQELIGEISLDDLKKRHAASREKAKTATPEVCGEVIELSEKKKERTTSEEWA